MSTKLSKPLQTLHDQVKQIPDVRASVAALTEGFANELEAADGDSFILQRLVLELRLNADEWANVCVQNTPAATHATISAQSTLH
jgi:hypothetical protein